MPDPVVPTLIGTEPTEDEAKRLAEAVALLQESERPTFPFRMLDPDPKKYPVFRRAPTTQAFAEPTDQIIYVNRGGEFANGSLPMLAAILGHEQYHVAHGPDEGAAYQQQYDILKRLGYEKQDPKWMMQLYRRIQQRKVGRR